MGWRDAARTQRVGTTAPSRRDATLGGGAVAIRPLLQPQYQPAPKRHEDSTGRASAGLVQRRQHPYVHRHRPAPELSGQAHVGRAKGQDGY